MAQLDAALVEKANSKPVLRWVVAVLNAYVGEAPREEMNALLAKAKQAASRPPRASKQRAASKQDFDVTVRVFELAATSIE